MGFSANDSDLKTVLLVKSIADTAKAIILWQLIMINPFDLDPYEAKRNFQIFRSNRTLFFSQIHDVSDDISYMLHHHYHPENMSKYLILR